MTTEQLVARAKRLDRLYLAADAARSVYLAQTTGVNLRRWRYYERRYRQAVADYPAWLKGEAA